VLGFLAILQMMSAFPLVSQIAAWNWLTPMTLLIGYWFGFVARSALVWGLESTQGRQAGMAVAAVPTLGLAYSLVLFLADSTLLIRAWAVLLAVAGWLLVSATADAGRRPVG
jgi:hypothetical protein